MKTTMSSKGQIVLPAEIRREDGIVAGQEFDMTMRLTGARNGHECRCTRVVTSVSGR